MCYYSRVIRIIQLEIGVGGMEIYKKRSIRLRAETAEHGERH